MNKIVNTIIVSVMALFMVSCSSTEDDNPATDTSVEYSFPGEWERHEGTWLIWPHDYGVITSEYVDMIEGIWFTMTEALHTGERVHIVAYNEVERNRISTLLAEGGE